MRVRTPTSFPLSVSPARLDARAILVVLGFSLVASCASTVTPGAAGDASTDAIVVTDSVEHSDTTTAIDAPQPASTIFCPADAGVIFPSSLDTCAINSDCVAVVHGLDCCGSLEYVGVNGTQRDSFGGPEMTCDALLHLNMCLCDPRDPVSQDGHAVMSAMSVGVDCVGGVCLTRAL